MLDDAEVRAGLDAVRAAGVRVGLSVTGTGQAATIEHALEVGGFDEVQATWNLHERSAEAALARARRRARGLRQGGAGERAAHRARRAAALAARPRERGTTEDALALAAALAQPWADVVLSGAATVEQLGEQPRGPGRRVGRLEELREPARYWATRRPALELSGDERQPAG